MRDPLFGYDGVPKWSPFVSCAVFALVAIDLAQGSARSNFALAMAIWLIGPRPVILTNAAFMTLYRVFVAARASGWPVKLLIFAAALSLWPPRE